MGCKADPTPRSVYLQVSKLVNHQVLRLEVPIRDVARVQVFERARHVRCVEGRLGLVEPAARGDEREELASLDQVH